MTRFIVVTVMDMQSLTDEQKTELRVAVATAGFKTQHAYSQTCFFEFPPGTYEYISDTKASHDVVGIFTSLAAPYFKQPPKVMCVSFGQFSSNHLIRK